MFKAHDYNILSRRNLGMKGTDVKQLDCNALSIGNPKASISLTHFHLSKTSLPPSSWSGKELCGFVLYCRFNLNGRDGEPGMIHIRDK